MVHTPSRRADRQALRSALVLSANDGGQITLTKILENYPTAVVEVEGDRLESAYRLLQRLGGRERSADHGYSSRRNSRLRLEVNSHSWRG